MSTTKDTEQFAVHLVRVRTVVKMESDSSVYKRVEVLEQTGYWLSTFFINFFDSQPLYDIVAVGMELRVKVKYFSKRYRTLLDAELFKITSCTNCGLFHEPTLPAANDICLPCTTSEPATRIEDEWELLRCVVGPKRTRLYFKQGKRSLCHCIWNTDDKYYPTFQAKHMYQLQGWQQNATRHNVIAFGA